MKHGSQLKLANLEDVEFEYDMNQFICTLKHVLKEEDLKLLQENKIVDVKGYLLDGKLDQAAATQIRESVK
ncbi:hypothetical protein [Flammeovirga sp. OC4]|uniref:hypothetical protein n=1 Tax=Flammeovirga sp. OC4 TaxID=1382345 RepID=UPI0005C72506|nr:hypothetical protein [Flammeovirga sp. OC4]